jgi:hypothetical protein
MVTMFEVYTTEEGRSVVRFCGQKDPMQKMFIKKCFLITIGSICRIKRFTAGSKNVANGSLMTKRLKRRCGSGWDNSEKTCMLRVSGTSVSMLVEDMSRSKCFFVPGSNITYFTFYVHLWPLPRNNSESIVIIVTSYSLQGCFFHVL